MIIRTNRVASAPVKKENATPKVEKVEEKKPKKKSYKIIEEKKSDFFEDIDLKEFLEDN